MSKTETKTEYIFKYPYHGEERDIFCFRAFDKKHLRHWIKVLVTQTQLETSSTEILAHIEKVREDIQKWN